MRVILAVLVVLVAGCDSAPPKAAAPPSTRPSIVLYLIDTLRADHLGCFGYPRSVTPRLDAFAREADLATRAVAQSPWTRPSVASVLTGLGPLGHGVNRRHGALPADATTLAEILRDDGYRTAAFVTNDQVGRVFGFDQGFDDFEELHGSDPYLRRSSKHVANAAADWLDEHRGDPRPFFLYLHTIDPHAPYLPPLEQRQEFAPKVIQRKLEPWQIRALKKLMKRSKGETTAAVRKLRVGSVPWIIGLESGLIDVDERMLSDLRNLYDGEIAHNDHQLGRLLDHLRDLGLYDQVLIIVVSDHGEEFLEHGGWQHGQTLYSEVLDVPLLVKLPRSAGATLDRGRLPAQHIDLLPTILDVAGVAPPSDLPGRPLFVDREIDPEASTRPRGALSHLNLNGNRATSYIEGRWKLIRIEKPRPRLLLFDLEKDPLERADLSGQEAARAEALARRLEALSAVEGLESHTVTMDDETRRRLEALGYL